MKKKEDFIDSVFSLLKQLSNIVFEHDSRIAELERKIKAMEEK